MAKRRKYQQLPAYDIHTRIRAIMRDISKLEKGIAYLNGRLEHTDDPEWDQNYEEWQLFKRANRRYIKELRAVETELRQELTHRAIKVAAKKTTPVEQRLESLEQKLMAAVRKELIAS